MKIRCLPLAATLAMVALPWSALAQVSAPTWPPAASAPAAAKPGPRQLTPQQSRDSATAPGELRPEHAGVPQINIALGRKPPAVRPPGARGSSAASATGGISDGAARCEAESDDQARADCRARLARQGRMR